MMQKFASTSQSDIIRTLISRNCLDESVMSMALSPDCTPQKLLERLAEAERFDLALDVSMKLGLDVMSLWRTWAQRCLKGRNFPGAREKFRHCFMRLRLPGNRPNLAQSRLLAQILKDLATMDEVQLPLSEEIELIKSSKNSSAPSNDDDNTLSNISYEATPVTSKPKIYAECLYYLDAYGSVEDHIQFYAKNSLHLEAIKTFLDNSTDFGIEKFFVTEILMNAASTGCLSHLIGAFLRLDVNFVKSASLFKATYSFLSQKRHYNLLYFIQHSIGDYIAAACTQLNCFFLERSARDYKELSHRIPNLTSAQRNYSDYLEKLENDKSMPDLTKQSSLFTSMAESEVTAKLSIVDLQIEITRNFALNEVPGCINNIDMGTFEESKDANISHPPDSFPVTIFDRSSRRMTFFAALVLMYFDPACRTYFSERGFKLANQIISNYQLDKTRVFKTCMRIIIDDESCDIRESASLLLERVKEDFIATQAKETKKHNKTPIDRASKGSRPARVSLARTIILDDSNLSSSPKQPSLIQSSKTQPSMADRVRIVCDEIIRDSIGICREPDYEMELAKLLSNEAKIKYYIENGKLSNAQTLACQMNRPDYVSEIMLEAARLHQDHIKTVCQHWLAKRGQ